jgi:hypothetical protein
MPPLSRGLTQRKSPSIRPSAYAAIELNVLRANCDNLFEHFAPSSLYYHTDESPNQPFVAQSRDQQRTATHTADVVTLWRQTTSAEIDHLVSIETAGDLMIGNACDWGYGEIGSDREVVVGRHAVCQLGESAEESEVAG